MAFIQSALGHLVGALVQLSVARFGRDRRTLVVERRLKVLALAKELKAEGLTAGQLRRLEQQLTRD